MKAPAHSSPLSGIPVLPHRLPAELVNNRIQVIVVGCGGTGSQLLPGLARLHRTLIALGHPYGLSVTVYDDDAVALHNCVRQNFVETDVGANKAEVMVYRLNVVHAAAGIEWTAVPRRFRSNDAEWNTDFVIGCVDSKAARREIAAAVARTRHCYWIDAGNRADDGQVVVGEAGSVKPPADRPRLPLVSELLPEIVSGEDDNAPSCSAVESILRQGAITNQMSATWALAWLSEALRKGEIGWCGVFFNLATGRVSPIPVDPAAWARMGYAPSKARGRRKKAV